MTIFLQTLLIVLPVFFVIILGFLLKHFRLIDAPFLHQLNRLVFYVALPALLLQKISHADFHASFNPVLLAGILVTIALSYGGSYLYGTLRGYPPPKLGAFSQGASRGNLAFVGLAVAFNAYGEKGFAIVGVLAGFIIPVINMLSVLVLLLPQRRNNHSMTRAFWMYQFAFNPLIIAAFAGIALSYSGLTLPTIVDRALNIVTGMALPLALISIGAAFSRNQLKGDLAAAGIASCIKLVLQPLITGLLLTALGLRGMELGVGIIIAGTPTAAAAYIMAEQLRCDAELSGTIIMLSTACSLISYTGALYILTACNL